MDRNKLWLLVLVSFLQLINLTKAQPLPKKVIYDATLSQYPYPYPVKYLHLEVEKSRFGWRIWM